MNGKSDNNGFHTVILVNHRKSLRFLSLPRLVWQLDRYFSTEHYSNGPLILLPTAKQYPKTTNRKQSNGAATGNISLTTSTVN